MPARLTLAAALLLAAPAFAQDAEATPEGAEAQSTRLTCADGRVVDIAFPDAASAAISVDDGPIVGMALIPEGDVAAGESEAVAETEEAVADAGGVERPRYAGNGFQWVADGTAQGTLSAEGDAADPGTLCTAEPAVE